MSLNTNRRSFLQLVSFFAASVATGIALNPFDFLKKAASEKTDLALPKKYTWCYCDKVGLKNILYRLRETRKGRKKFYNPDIIVAINPEKSLRELLPAFHFSKVDLMDLGIENFLVQGVPVVSYSGAKELHQLKMLGRRIYAA